MNVTKPSVTGIDIPIQKLQTYLYGELKTKWGYTDANFNMYGRAYRNQTADGYTPEVYTVNREYKEVFFDDKLWGLAFFNAMQSEVVKAGTVRTECYVIFMVNLEKIKPKNPRNDEEARVDVGKLLMSAIYGFQTTGVIVGIERVFEDYTGWKKEDGIKYRDMHPLHCFRYNFDLIYDINKCK